MKLLHTISFNDFRWIVMVYLMVTLRHYLRALVERTLEAIFPVKLVVIVISSEGALYVILPYDYQAAAAPTF